MKKYCILLFLLISGLLKLSAQKIQSPEEFLGYKPGEQFTPHFRVVEYYKYLVSVSKNIKPMKAVPYSWLLLPLIAISAGWRISGKITWLWQE